MSELALNPFLWNLLYSLIAVIVMMTITAIIGTKINNHSIIDIVWGLGFAVIGLVSYVASSGHGNDTRRLVVFVLVAVWGLRLGVYLAWRNRGHVDPRYVSIMKRREGPLIPFLFKKIYGLQGAVMWVVSLPVQIAMYESAGLNVFAYIGIVMWAIGIFFEAVGDYQLAQFKADPANEGKILESGLWGWTRHPNYFGDSMVWFGFWFLALGHWAGIFTVVGPALITWSLVNASGKALTEKRMARKRGPEYQEYLERVSGFLPRPPKRTS